MGDTFQCHWNLNCNDFVKFETRGGIDSVTE